MMTYIPFQVDHGEKMNCDLRAMQTFTNYGEHLILPDDNS